MNNSLLIRSLVGGFISVAAFSLTAPATKAAVSDFSPFAVTGMRGLIAGLFCLTYILIRRSPIPRLRTLGALFLVALVGSCGFAGFLAVGLQTVPATHASVFLAMLPLMTAIASQLMLPEKTTRLFWVGAGLGAIISVGFMIHRSYGHMAIGDFFLFISVVCAAWGYIRAAKITREIGGAATMSWIVITGSPLYLALLILGQPDFSRSVSMSSIVALLYLGTISQALGMFLWCWSLSTGYAAIVSQTQVLQPFLSMFASAWLLSEAVEGEILWVTFAVMACVGLSTYAKFTAPKQNPECLATPSL